MSILFCIFIFPQILGKIAPNVKAIRRFCAANKGTAGFQWHKNVPEKNPTKGYCPTGIFRRPSRYCGAA
jgi:hypothetical protein